MAQPRLTKNRRPRLSNRLRYLAVFVGFSIATACSQTNFNRLNFDIGGGLGIGKGTVGALVGGSYFGEVGGGLNFSRMFGFNGEYMYYDLPLKSSVIQQEGLPGAAGHLHGVTLNGIVHAPLGGRLGAYGIFGIGFYRRSVSARTEQLPAGTNCAPAFIWWNIQCITSNGISVVSPPQTLSSFSKDAGGFNAGGGVTYRLNYLHRAKVYVEARYHRAYHSDRQTTFIPVAIGVRW
jgi:hypothetical protein